MMNFTPVNVFLLVQLTAIRFDEQHELIWAGENGVACMEADRWPDAPSNKEPETPDRDASMKHGINPGCRAVRACMASTHTSTLPPPMLRLRVRPPVQHPCAHPGAVRPLARAPARQCGAGPAAPAWLLPEPQPGAGGSPCSRGCAALHTR